MVTIYNINRFTIYHLTGVLSDETIKFYSAEILNGKEYLHSKNIIHGDLKPENIVLSNKMHLKLADFGSASIKDHYYDLKENCFKKIESKEESEELIHNNELLGTADYLSPELLYGYTPGFESDLWSYGCIIYFLIAGKTPFCSCSSNTSVFENIIKNQVEFSDKVIITILIHNNFYNFHYLHYLLSFPKMLKISFQNYLTKTYQKD